MFVHWYFALVRDLLQPLGPERFAATGPLLASCLMSLHGSLLLFNSSATWQEARNSVSHETSARCDCLFSPWKNLDSCQRFYSMMKTAVTRNKMQWNKYVVESCMSQAQILIHALQDSLSAFLGDVSTILHLNLSCAPSCLFYTRLTWLFYVRSNASMYIFWFILYFITYQRTAETL